MYVVRRCLYVFFSALCHAHSQCFVRLPFASQSLPLSLRCCPTACCSQRPSHTNTHTHMCGCIWLYILFVFVLLMFSTFASLNAFAARCIWLRSTSLPAALPQLSVVSVVCLLHSTHLRCCRCCCWQPVCMALSLMFLPLCLSFDSYSFVSWRISCVLFRFFPTPVCHFVCLYINALVPVCACVCVAARKLIIML